MESCQGKSPYWTTPSDLPPFRPRDTELRRMVAEVVQNDDIRRGYANLYFPVDEMPTIEQTAEHVIALVRRSNADD